MSQKALRLYDELDLLSPARVDSDSGYRFCETGQLEQTGLVAMFRQIGLPLAEISVVLGLEPPPAARQIAADWSGREQEHGARRELAGYVVASLNGKSSVMYEVTTREIPVRSVLCLERSVNRHGAWAFGKEFVGLLQERPLPPMEGVAGAAFCIYHGEVSDDSDGPVEWCRPVPGDQANELAARFPGEGNQMSPARWQFVSEALRIWGTERDRQPSELGVRVTFLAPSPVTPESVPDCDFAVPLL